MRPRLQQVILQSVGLLLVAGIQVYSGYLHLLFSQRFRLGQFDSATLGLAITETLLGLASGFLIALILLPRPIQAAVAKTPGIVLALSILLPTLALAIKWGAATNSFHLRLNFLAISDWAINSGVAPLWLGISIVVLIYNLKNNN